MFSKQKKNSFDDFIVKHSKSKINPLIDIQSLDIRRKVFISLIGLYRSWQNVPSFFCELLCLALKKKAFKELIVWIILFHDQHPDEEIHLPNRKECTKALLKQYHTVKQGVCECLQHSFMNQVMNDETTKMRTCMLYFSLKLSEIFSNSQRNLKFVKYFQFPNTYLIFPNEI